MKISGQASSSGLARRSEPGATDDRLPKKEKSGNVAGKVRRPEPPAEVVDEAIKLYRGDTRGRWRVGNYLPSGRHRPYSSEITLAEVRRLLWLLWPKYVDDQKRIAVRRKDRDVSRVVPSWRYALEVALDREAQSRREFAARREKWDQRQRELKRLSRQRTPPEQRRELERKEHDERMRALYAEYDERDKIYARRVLHDIKVAITKGRSDQYRYLLDDIAATGPDGATVLEIAYIALGRNVRELRLNPPDEVERWGNDIAQALAARGLVCAVAPNRFIQPAHKGGRDG